MADAAAGKLEGQLVLIDTFQQRLYDLEAQLAAYQPHADSPSLSSALVSHRTANERNPKNIAAEDALDTIVRLENALKLEQHNNMTRAKEVGNLRAQLTHRRRALDEISQRVDELMAKTGWDGQTNHAQDELDTYRHRIDEMVGLIATLTDEHKAANLLNKKKEGLVLTLQAELDNKEAIHEQMLLRHNDVRVKDRESHEVEAKIKQLKTEDSRIDKAMSDEQGSRDPYALEAVQYDNQSLTAEIRDLRQRRSDQEKLLNEQRERTALLTKRIEVVHSAMRDLRLEALLPSGSAKTAGAMVAGGGADDAAGDAFVPVAVYELLHRDVGALRDTLGRKDILYVEKRAVSTALASRLDDLKRALDLVVQQQMSIMQQKEADMQWLDQQLKEQHADYRHQMDVIVSENLVLKKKLQHPAPTPAVVVKK